MKRVLQFAATLVILLLAGQPAFAGLACAMSGTMQASSCPMSMSAMSADCPMMHGVAPECTQDCCNGTAPKPALLLAVPAKPNLVAGSAAVSPVVEARLSAAPRQDWLPAMVESSPPPHYILNRVFRI
ncbi:MAG TPA: hypothetical protein VG267_07520 [Terracidiphilus sp.]|jgi:hypothetical protein|nr:hypothetical protein [Terracidiphilus sp.]